MTTHSVRLLLFAVCVLGTVGLCAGFVLCHASRARQLEAVRAMGVAATGSTRLRVDLRASTRLGAGGAAGGGGARGAFSGAGGRFGAGRLRGAAYIQMAAPPDELEPVELYEDSLGESATASGVLRS